VFLREVTKVILGAGGHAHPIFWAPLSLVGDGGSA
jgi:hypothetical protein